MAIEEILQEVDEQTEQEDQEEVQEEVTVVAEPKKEQESRNFLEEKQEEKPSTRVPLPDLISERKKRQAAENELRELREKIERQTDDIDLSDVIKDPEELLDGKTALSLIQRTAGVVSKKAREETLAEIEQRETERARKAEFAERQQQLQKSEAEARKQFSDFDSVVSTAIDGGYFTDDELASIKRSKNPGAVLYRKSKEVLSIMNLSTKPENKEPTPEQIDSMDDENLYDAIYNKPG